MIKPKVRRRRRRRKSQLIADRVIAEVKRRERDFLREASKILSEAIGFPVRVSRVKLAQPTNIEMRRAQRMSKADAKAQVVEAFAPPPKPEPVKKRKATGGDPEMPPFLRRKRAAVKVLNDALSDIL